MKDRKEGKKEEKEKSGEKIRESKGRKEGRKRGGRKSLISLAYFFLYITTVMFSGLEKMSTLFYYDCFFFFFGHKKLH